MHNGMQYDPIKGNGQGHDPFISAIYNGSWQLTTDSYTRAQYLNIFRGQLAGPQTRRLWSVESAT